MKDEINELTLDILEQVRYLQELGVQSLAAELPMALPLTGGAVSVSAPVMSSVPETLYALRAKGVTVPPQGSGPAGSRLASLPSLAAREPVPVYARGGVTPEDFPDVPNNPDQPTETPPMPDVPANPEQPGTPGPIETPAPPDVPATPETPGRPDTPLISIEPRLPEPTETIEQIRADIGNCTRCPLHERRTQVVHSTGNFQAELMFVGEAPGADEDVQGAPFVGRAGQLLTDIIKAIGFDREQVFIGNVNRCRPPGNRTPLPLESAACRPFLLREVAVVRPKVIVVMGNVATQNLLDVKTPISKLRGRFQEYFGVKVMPTFHPAYLLRDPHKKREVWEDMKMVRDHLAAAK